ncbi:MAG: NAD-dependent epimerase/dehydratase family protein, partial [Opitutia bacterium]
IEGELADKVTFVRGDVADPAAVDAAVRGCDHVFHVAAKAGVWGAWKDYVAANIDGTRHVVEACGAHGVRTLVHTSTPSVVFNGGPFRGADESLPYGRDWLCAYAETKAVAEELALRAASATLKVCALRPHLIWGPGDPHIFPRILVRARAGRLRIVGDG